MRKAFGIIITLCMLAMFPAAVFADTAEDIANSKRPKVLLNGEAIAFNQEPYVKDGVTMAPARTLLESLGFNVGWNEETKQLAGFKYGTELRFSLDQKIATINNAAYQLPKPVHMLDGEVYIPLRFAAEADGRTVSWHASEETVEITTKEMKKIRVALRMSDAQSEADTVELVKQLSKHLEENNKISVQWEHIPADYYQEKLNLMIAAGDMADLSYTPDITIFPLDLLSSITWKLDSHITKYSALNKLSEQAVEEVRAVYNDLYAIPKLASSIDASFPVANEHWLDRLGLVAPKTMDELYTVMEMFASYDPDANGKKDTYGLTGYIDKNSLGTLAWVEHVFNENASRYELKDGKLVDLAASEGTRKALQWLTKAYAEGLIDPEVFVLTKAAATKGFKDGKAGFLAMKLAEAAEAGMDSKQQFKPLISLKSSDSAQAVTGAQSAYQGAYIVSSLSKKEKLDGALEMMNALHTIANDQKQDDQLRHFAKEITGTSEVKLDNASKAIKERYNQIAEARELIAAKPLLETQLYAKLDNQQRSIKYQLDEEMLQLKVKVIMGAATIDQWDQYISNLQKNNDYVSIMDAFSKK